MAAVALFQKNVPIGERFLESDDIIVSKTDTKGIITYANDVFSNISGYEYNELIGKPHNLIRHPLMPSCVFKLLWDTIKEDREIFAYVLNLCKGGQGFYWVFAHVTSSKDADGQVIGYHSNRRKPSDATVKVISGVYSTLLEEEKKHSTRRAATQAGYDLLIKILSEKGISYEEFVLSL